MRLINHEIKRHPHYTQIGFRTLRQYHWSLPSSRNQHTDDSALDPLDQDRKGETEAHPHKGLLVLPVRTGSLLG